VQTENAVSAVEESGVMFREMIHMQDEVVPQMEVKLMQFGPGLLGE
jgi:hypothetical protein